jgi:hypothetical protein
MRFNVKGLMDMLSNFPSDLEIITELSFLWNYPDELREGVDDIDSEDFMKLSMSNATELLIFEGSWEKDNISDVDNVLEEYLQIND